MKPFSLLNFLFLIAPFAVGAQTPIITELCLMPAEVLETSGLENGPNHWFWTHNDSSNPAELFCIDTTGITQRLITVIGDFNNDWEEITKDNEGNLYIGNFGNNSLNRADLRIVKIPSIDTCTGITYVTDTINFTYPDQNSFPPAGTYGNFDMEAMFHYQNKLHLFSKDRSNPAVGYSKHYTLPQVGGTYVATLVDSVAVGHTSYVFSITSADISEDGSQVALLTSDRIWLFSNFTGTDFFGGNVSELTLSVFSQKEGICFRNGFLYVTDEQSFGMGGKMYRIDPSIFVSIEDDTPKMEVKPIYDSNLNLVEFHLPLNQPCEWQLFNTDGKLLQSGNSTNVLNASKFKKKSGMYAIRMSFKGSQKSLLFKL
jgi:hypothetical protein